MVFVDCSSPGSPGRASYNNDSYWKDRNHSGPRGREPYDEKSYWDDRNNERDRYGNANSYTNPSSSLPSYNDNKMNMNNKAPPDFRPQSQVDTNFRDKKPINYQFSAKSKENNGSEQSANEEIYQESEDFELDVGNRLLGQYKSSKKGSAAVTLASTIIGAGMGFSLAKSSHILPPQSTMFLFASLFFITSLTKFKPPNAGNSSKDPTNPFSLFTQTMGLTLLLLMQRTRSIRKEFPTKPHLANIIRPSLYPRKSFPPPLNDDEEEDSNPWKYEVQPQDSMYMEQYSMIKILLGMAFVGSICGSNLPLIPSWIGALAGAGSLCFLSTQRNSNGDLGRVMGMKVVSLFTELLIINEELNIWKKCKVVLNIIFDKLLILDRKHSIRDKISFAIKWLYEKVMGFINNVRADVEGREPTNDDNDDDDDNNRARPSDTSERNRNKDRYMEKERNREVEGEYRRDNDPSQRRYRPDDRDFGRPSSRYNQDSRYDDSRKNNPR